MSMPERPISNKPVMTLQYGDVVHADGHYVMDVDASNAYGEDCIIRVSDGSQHRILRATGQLPFYGNVRDLADSA